jgi:hypothetical protein
MPQPDKNFEKLLREEWDFNPSENKDSNFRACSDDELYDCFEYEYSRAWIFNGGTLKGVVQNSSSLKRFYKLCAAHFPLTPWLKIPSEARAAILSRHRKDAPSYPPLFRCGLTALNRTADGLVDAIGFGEQGLVHVTAMPFVFSWHYSNGELVEAFKQWLEENEPKASDDCKVKKPGKDERATVRKALKALGAMRLLKNREYKSAVKHSKIGRGNAQGLFAEKASVWRAAEKQADRIIKAWATPIQKQFTCNENLEARLLSQLSKENAKDCGRKPLEKWIAERAPLQVARRFLTMSRDKAEERMSWICRFPVDEAAQDVAKARRVDHWEEQLMAKRRR